jgi:Fe-S cluster assembly protein SufD
MTTKTENPLNALVDAPQTTGPDWLNELRREAAGSFLELGVPTIRHEEWRWTNLKPLLSHSYVQPEQAEVTEADLEPYLLRDADRCRMVFVNGQYEPKLSRIPGTPETIKVGPISQLFEGDEGLSSKLARYADHHAQPFVALNTALFADGAYIRAGRDAVLEFPVHVLHVSKADASSPLVTPRVLLIAGENAEVQLIESFVGLGEAPRFVNSVSEISLQQGARVQHTKLLREAKQGYHIGWTEARVDRDADYRNDNISLDAALARNDLNVVLAGEGGHAELKGLVLGRESEHFDNHLLIEHARPHCSSNQLYRSVVDDKSRSVFSGKVIVRPGAVGTDAQQQNNNLLLSDDAKVDTKPQLEIYCDDVKCSHGATSGQLDPEAIFFLRTRGMGEKQARNVLTWAFANDVIEHVEIEEVRQALEAIMQVRFHGLLGV